MKWINTVDGHRCVDPNLKLKKSRLWHSYWNVTFRYPSLHTFFTIVFYRKPIEDMAGRWAM